MEKATGKIASWYKRSDDDALAQRKFDGWDTRGSSWFKFYEKKVLILRDGIRNNIVLLSSIRSAPVPMTRRIGVYLDAQYSSSRPLSPLISLSNKDSTKSAMQDPNISPAEAGLQDSKRR